MFERVPDTATELPQTVGYDGFTLQEVVAQAKVSICSIYGQANGKDDFVVAVPPRVMQRIDDEQIELFNVLRRQHAEFATPISATVKAMAEHLRPHESLRSRCAQW